MGTWGTGLYGNDETADLRDEFKQVVRAPWDGDELAAWVTAHYPRSVDVSLALADLFWRYGIEHARTTETALKIVADGIDLNEKRSLGMGERDVVRRAKILDGLARKWSTPNPKPWSRKRLRAPEAFVLEVGDCLVYPTSAGDVRNPYVSARAEEWYYAIHSWTQDGWGSAVVLGRYHRLGWFARYVVALVRGDSQGAITPSEFADLPILHTSAYGAEPRRRVHAVSTSKAHLGRMQVEVVGRLMVDEERVAADFGGLFDSEGADFANDAWTRHPRGDVGAVDDPIDRYLVPASSP